MNYEKLHLEESKDSPSIPESEEKALSERNILVEKMKEIRQAPNGDYILPPEIKELIMEKVKDINEPGTGVHSIKSWHPKLKESREDSIQILESVLASGIVTSMSIEGEEGKWVDEFHPGGGNYILQKKKLKDFMWKYRKVIKDKRLASPYPYFNIVGKSIKSIDSTIFANKRFITILFDVNKLLRSGRVIIDGLGNKDAIGKKWDEYYRKIKLGEQIESWEDIPGAWDELFGYMLARNDYDRELGDSVTKYYPRIPSRFFNGIVLNDDYLSPDELQEIIKIMIQVNQKHPERLLPIYDIYGNLIWPEYMSYNRIKEMSEEKGI